MRILVSLTARKKTFILILPSTPTIVLVGRESFPSFFTAHIPHPDKNHWLGEHLIVPHIMSIEKPVSPTEVEAAERSDDSGEGPSWTEAEETAIRHKLDWQIVPTITILYLLCFLDR